MKKTGDQIVRNACRTAGAAFRSCFCDGRAGKTFVANCATVVKRTKRVVVAVVRVASASVDERTVQGFVVWQVAVPDSVACKDRQGLEVTANSRCSYDLIVKIVTI